MIQTLSTFYRRSLADDPTADVPLREEFALQRLYLDIEAVRFPEPAARASTTLPRRARGRQVPGHDPAAAGREFGQARGRAVARAR